jgi:hypothetical protein
VFTTKLEKLATPLLTPTEVVPEVKLDCALPPAIDTVTEPLLAVVTTLPKLSWTATSTEGIALPAVPGPGAAGLKASLDAAPALIVSDWVPADSPLAEAVTVGDPDLVSP